MNFVKTEKHFINLDFCSMVQDFPDNNPPVVKIYINEENPAFHATGQDRTRILEAVKRNAVVDR